MLISPINNNNRLHNIKDITRDINADNANQLILPFNNLEFNNDNNNKNNELEVYNDLTRGGSFSC